MNLNKVFVADIETDGLLDDLTKLHVLSYGYRDAEGVWKIKSTNKKEDVIKLFVSDYTIVMHYGRCFDRKAIEKIYGIEVTATIIDSLSLAWYLEPLRKTKFGLEVYGEDFGIKKPEVTDWVNITYEQAAHRCQEDVKINIQLYIKLFEKLELLYDNNHEDMERIINMLNWIIDCSYMQEQQKIQLDIAKTESNLKYFSDMKQEKVAQLIAAMPKVAVSSIKARPKKMYTVKGALTKAGVAWLEMLQAMGLPEDYSGEIEVVKNHSDANPNSVKQKKDWLYSLGWKPKTFKHNRNKETNEVKIVEQILTSDKMLCPSILELVEKEPAIEVLDGLTVLTHRIGVLKGFLKNADQNGMIYQGLMGLAVTMRWQHTTLVNLPRVTGTGDIRDGQFIRECLVAGTGKKIVQSDLSGIESRTSDHYTFHINPDRIKKTKAKYFDPHTEIAVVSGMMSEQEETWFKYTKEIEDCKKEGKDCSELYPEMFGDVGDEFYALESLSIEDKKKRMAELKVARTKAKTTNYSCLYNVGSASLARDLEIKKSEAQALIDAYWDVNYAVKEVSKTFKTKEVLGETWIYNPVSRFWYILKNDKDRFSVINQSTAVYCFNVWVYNCTRMGVWPCMQSHDDQVYITDEDDAERVEGIYRKAMELLNKQVKLNVELACETQVGNTLADTH